jgi:major intracellular serine protease
MSFLEPIISLTDALVGENTFNFLNQSGRRGYYKQGIYGQGVTVAVIDTGIRASHDEFDAGRIIGGKSFCQYTTGYVDDHGHGTHVAGTIAGKNAGIAPKANLLIIKALDGGGDNHVDRIIDAFEYVAAWRNPQTGEPVDIASASLSIPQKSMSDAQIVRFDAACKSIVQAGIALFVSSGNTGTDATPRYPSFYDDPITVGAVDTERRAALFSTRSSAVDICQVGTSVVSASHGGDRLYVTMSGTSMATPLSAGIAALIICKYKLLTRKRMSEQVLYETIKYVLTHDIDALGIDKASGAGFLTLDPFPPVEVSVEVGSKTYYVDGKPHEMDVAPVLVDERMLVPLRFIGEGVGMTVDWYANRPMWAYIRR